MGRVKPMPVRERGQVSIETLLLAAVILMIGIVIISYYAEIKDSTTAMQLLKVEALKRIDETQGQIVIEEIDYKIVGSTISLCLFTEPGDLLDAAAKAEIAGLIESKTEFEPGSVTIYQIPPDGEGSCS